MNNIMIPIGGEERRIKFTIGAIQELEAQLDSRNVLKLMQTEVWSVTDIISACHCALKVFDRTLTRKVVQEWVAEYAEAQEMGIYKLQMYLLSALGMSGLIGGVNKSAFESILGTLTDANEENGEGK